VDKRRGRPLASAAGLAALAAIGGYAWHGARSGAPATVVDPPAAVAAPAVAVDAETVASPAVAAPAAKAASLAEPAADALLPGETEAMKAIFARFATGDFVSALHMADEKAQLDSASPAFHEWLIAQLPALLTSAGWARLKVGDCDEATQYLRRAEALRRTPETSKGLAVCYYKQKNPAGAREQFAYYLDKSPDDYQMQVLNADALESEGAYDEAIHALEQAQAAAAKDAASRDQLAAIDGRLKSMRARGQESSLQSVESSTNFRLAFRAGDYEDLVGFVFGTLEDALAEYIEEYGFKPPPAPIEVGLYPVDAFKNVVVGGPEWAEGIFDGRLRIPIRDPRETASLTPVLRHELVHALFALMGDDRTIPSWFDEGMAQRLSCPHGNCGAFQYPPQPGQFLPPSAFFSPYVSFDAVKAGRAYRQSLFLIDVIVARHGDDALRRLVGGISVASDLSSDGLLRPLGQTFAELHELASGIWHDRTSPERARP
jgi:tetratricopeptide (TPR) repeat protein